MDQYQQNPGTADGNPYEFILNPEKPSKPKKIGIGGNKLVRLAIFLVGGALAFMIIATVLLNALTPKTITSEDLLGLAQTQTELIRVSTQGSNDAVQQVTRNLGTTVQYTMVTQQTQTLDLLGTYGVKTVSKKQLALKQNGDTDQRFVTAKSTSTFDKTFASVMQEELTAYAATLKQLSSKARAQADRDRLSDYYRQTQLLISQIPYTQESIESGSATTAQ